MYGLSKAESIRVMKALPGAFLCHNSTKLKEHLAAVTALMRAAANWDIFQRSLARAFPKLNDTLEMPLDD